MANKDKTQSKPIPQEDVDYIVEVLDTMIGALVDDEEAVEIRPVISPSRTSILLEVAVAERDMAFVMGQGGCNAEAVKTILHALCSKLRVAFMINFTARQS